MPGFSTEDHPRVCGERMRIDARNCEGEGSPPRVRGTVDAANQALESFRITPACAGNGFGVRAGLPGYGDHPRVCGERQLLSQIEAVM